MVKSILLTLLGLLLGLVTAEALVRLLDPSYANGVKLFQVMESERGKFCRYDATLGWDGIPDAVGDFEWIDCHFQVRQNHFGYRSQPYDLARSKNPRIVAVGDSFTWGFGVDNDDAFTRVVEKESPSPVEVVNMGISGFGTDQEFLLWRQKAHAWKPDTVWLMTDFLTDLYDNAEPNRYNYAKPQFLINSQGRLKLTNVPVPPRNQPWSDPAQNILSKNPHVWGDRLHHSALACLTLSALSQRPAWRTRLEKQGLILPMMTGYKWESAMYQVPYNPDLEKTWTLMDRIVDEFSRDVSQAGGRLTLVLIPSAVQVYPEMWDKFVKGNPISADKHWDLQAPTQRLAAIGRKHGLDVVDLLPDLQEAGKTDAHLYFPVNMHWTRSGHRVVAHTLLKHLPSKR